MPISRVMNNPDGSTPVPQYGGGTNQGTLARSILHHQAGTGCIPRDMARHLHAQTSTMGVPGAVAPLSALALDELEETTQIEDSARAELAEARAEESSEVEDVGGETTPTEPAGRAATDGDDAGNGKPRSVPHRRSHRTQR